MHQSNKKIGDKGELIAIEYLLRHSYFILDSNFKFGRFGEIDIIASKGDLTVFFEVKYRTNDKYGEPEEAITKYKLARCKKTVYYYCKVNRVDFEKIRFDVITIKKLKKSYRLKHYKNIEI